MKEQYIKIGENGDKFYYSDEEMTVLHRQDGAAIEGAYGYKEWYINGVRHREDGPAIEGANGYKVWYINGVHHREDGPAIEYTDGTKVWYIDGVELTEEQLKNHLTLLPKNRRSRVERVLRYALCSDSRR